MNRGITIYVLIIALLGFLIYSINYGVNKKITYEESDAHRRMFTLDTPASDYSDETLLGVTSPRELLIAKIKLSAKESGIDPEVAVSVAQCESSLNPRAKHFLSSASGLYQFTSPTWEWINAEGSPFNEDDAIREFVKWFPVYPGWWKDCI